MGVDRVELRQATCPVNTPQATPLEVDCSFPQGKVLRIGLVIPYGHAYVTGLAIARAHQIIIPSSGNSWLIGDDETLSFDYDDTLYSGQWSVFTYNQDIANQHSWYLRFFIQELTSAQEATITPPVTTADLATVAVTDQTTPQPDQVTTGG